MGSAAAGQAGKGDLRQAHAGLAQPSAADWLPCPISLQAWSLWASPAGPPSDMAPSWLVGGPADGAAHACGCMLNPAWCAETGDSTAAPGLCSEAATPAAVGMLMASKACRGAAWGSTQHVIACGPVGAHMQAQHAERRKPQRTANGSSLAGACAPPGAEGEGEARGGSSCRHAGSRGRGCLQAGACPLAGGAQPAPLLHQPPAVLHRPEGPPSSAPEDHPG